MPDWTNTNPGARANLTGGVGPFAIADSDHCGTGSTLDTIMSTGMLDFTGLISPTVSFNTDYDDFGVGDDQAILDASTDGGTTWTHLFTWDSDHRGPLLVNQALPGAGENDVMVRWHYARAPGTGGGRSTTPSSPPASRSQPILPSAWTRPSAPTRWSARPPTRSPCRRAVAR